MQATSVGEAVNTAVREYEAGRLAPAERACRAVLQSHPQNAHALHLLGAITYKKGLHNQAIELVREAIAQDQDVPQFHNTLGAALRAAGQFEEAIAAYERAISLDPEYLRAYINMGNALVFQGRYARAAEKYRHVISLDPTCVEAYDCMAVALQYQGQYDAAIVACNQALALDPDDVETYNTMACVLMRQGRCAEAIETYKRVLQIKPDYAKAHCNLGMALLLSGRLREGWAEYRWRVRTGNVACSPRYDSPCWDGSPFVGKRLVVHFEQGFGDNIQFIRYLPMVKRRGGTVICEMLRPLVGLLRGFPGIDELVEASSTGKSSINSDLHVPLLELPRIFGTALHTIPCDVPYLHADLLKAEYWRKKLSMPGFKVGIVWAGTPAHMENRARSCRLSHFLRLSKVPGMQLIGLQKGAAAGQADEMATRMSVMNLADELHDFTDTAAVIANLDLVISVDTAVLHLAGAMAKPAWAVLSFAPDWRWMLDRDHSLWYPSIRLFRQSKYGDWGGVFERIAEELAILSDSMPVTRGSSTEIQVFTK